MFTALFKKTTEASLLQTQLQEAQRCRAIYRAEAEQMDAIAQMYDQRAQRIEKELSDIKGQHA